MDFIIFYLAFLSASTLDLTRVVDTLAAKALNKPNILQWQLDGYHLIVNWEHSDAERIVDGYYVFLCQVADSLCEAPDFVHFPHDARSGRIVGLAPETIYMLKVIVFEGDQHVMSSPVTVNTRGLKFLPPKNLTVVKVTCCSALFQWHHEAGNNVHDVHFKLQCTGVTQYMNKNNEIIEEEDQFSHLSYSTSNDIEDFFADHLTPNTRYFCSISSCTETIEAPPSQYTNFTTLPGPPSTPPTPVLSLSHKSSFTASLKPTDEKYGPISHYLLIAVPVIKAPGASLMAPYEPLVPLQNILVKALSSNMVSAFSEPLPFVVTSFGAKDLPINYNFGHKWRSVFKQDTYYSVVLVAFTKSQGLYSVSALSNPPVYITKDLVEAWIHEQRPVVRHFTIIVICSILTVGLLFALGFLILFISNYYQAKRRDAKHNYMFVVSTSESSDEEIFSKDISTLKSSSQAKKKHRALVTPVNVLSERSPSMTPAEWAMENMSRSPAFRQMVLKHPESKDELNDVMTRIAYKWEANVEYDDEALTSESSLSDTDTHS